MSRHHLVGAVGSGCGRLTGGVEVDGSHGEGGGQIGTSAGPGNVLMIEISSAEVTEVVTGFGIKGVTAEQVASNACDEAQAYLTAGVPVGTYLADQLLLPMALAGGGAFRTLTPSAHTNTNAEVIGRFLDLPIRVESEQGEVYRIAGGNTFEDYTT